MPRVKHRDIPPPDGAAPAPIALKPLTVSGLVVAKASLIETLSALVPGLVDIATTEDGEHFWLMLGAGGTDAAQG
jgi:hypothetical protein